MPEPSTIAEILLETSNAPGQAPGAGEDRSATGDTEVQYLVGMGQDLWAITPASNVGVAVIGWDDLVNSKSDATAGFVGTLRSRYAKEVAAIREIASTVIGRETTVTESEDFTERGDPELRVCVRFRAAADQLDTWMAFQTSVRKSVGKGKLRDIVLIPDPY